MPNSSATGGYLTPVSPPLPEDDELVNILQEMVVGVTGLDPTLVRPRWQPNPPAMPRPEVNWCAIGISDDLPDDNPFVAHDPTAGAEGLGQDILARNEQITVLASFYGPNASGYAKFLRDGLYIEQNREALKEKMLYFVSAGTIRPVPDVRNLQWYPRQDISLRFNRGIERAYDVQNIATVVGTVHVDDNGDGFEVQISVNP